MGDIDHVTMYERYLMTIRKVKKIEDKELDKVQSAEDDTTVQLLKELVKVNQEIKDILSRLKDRFI